MNCTLCRVIAFRIEECKLIDVNGNLGHKLYTVNRQFVDSLQTTIFTSFHLENCTNRQWECTSNKVLYWLLFSLLSQYYWHYNTAPLSLTLPYSSILFKTHTEQNSLPFCASIYCSTTVLLNRWVSNDRSAIQQHCFKQFAWQTKSFFNNNFDSFSTAVSSEIMMLLISMAIEFSATSQPLN